MTVTARPNKLAPARRGIPTTYRETRFRSRLEARWAALFDLVGWSWVYEPFDADKWIPDFLIAGSPAGFSKREGVIVPAVNGVAPFLVEVGPCAVEPEFIDKAAKAIAAADRTTLVLGIAPHVLDGDRAGYLTSDQWSPASFALWGLCGVCGEVAVVRHIPTFDTYRHRPCGHYEDWVPVAAVSLADLWSYAGNQVQWRSR